MANTRALGPPKFPRHLFSPKLPSSINMPSCRPNSFSTIFNARGKVSIYCPNKPSCLPQSWSMSRPSHRGQLPLETSRWNSMMLPDSIDCPYLQIFIISFFIIRVLNFISNFFALSFSVLPPEFTTSKYFSSHKTYFHNNRSMMIFGRHKCSNSPFSVCSRHDHAILVPWRQTMPNRLSWQLLLGGYLYRQITYYRWHNITNTVSTSLINLFSGGNTKYCYCD